MASSHSRSRTWLAAFFDHPTHIYTAAIVLRVGLFLYGLAQDALSPVRYTDIDYYVFTDAARYVWSGLDWTSPLSSSITSPSASPYERDTYRYTPLLAWLLVPTAWTLPSRPVLSVILFSFGKLVFAACDIVVGILIFRICALSTTSAPALTSTATPAKAGSGAVSSSSPSRFRTNAVAAIWLLNPIVATISTRGSAEALLALGVVGTVAAVLGRRHGLAGLLLGLSVHFKIYPLIYGPTIVLWLAITSLSSSSSSSSSPLSIWTRVSRLAAAVVTTPAIWTFGLAAVGTFGAVNGAMYALYGRHFVDHTYLYHLVRIDHRHNFSVYNTALHLSHAGADAVVGPVRLESIAFVPQMVLSAVLIPAVLLWSHSATPTGRPAPLLLPAVLFLQTFAFVTFNKVCTSQYFLWYIVLLPFVILGSIGRTDEVSPSPSTSPSSPRLSSLNFYRIVTSRPAIATASWVAGQALWLRYAYDLEFLGRATFVPGLWLAGMAFFGVNVAILAWLVVVVGRW